MPRGMDLIAHEQEALDSIANWMSNRRRQTLNWDSPYHAFRKFIAAINEKSSATIHAISTAGVAL